MKHFYHDIVNINQDYQKKWAYQSEPTYQWIYQKKWKQGRSQGGGISLPVEEKVKKSGQNSQFFSSAAPIGTAGDQFTLIADKIDFHLQKSKFWNIIA